MSNINTGSANDSFKMWAQAVELISSKLSPCSDNSKIESVSRNRNRKIQTANNVHISSFLLDLIGLSGLRLQVKKQKSLTFNLNLGKFKIQAHYYVHIKSRQ